MNKGDLQGRCDTTSTWRLFNPDCKCKTYPQNMGPCVTWCKGGRERCGGEYTCSYCDHRLECHEETAMAYEMQSLEPNNPEQEAKVLENLVEWLRDSETKNSVKLLQARLVLEGVSRRLRGTDTGSRR